MLNNKNKLLLAAIVAAIIVFFAFLLPSQEQVISKDKPPMITETILQSIHKDNTDKRLEYAESKPIILSMEKHLRQFDHLMQIDPSKARAPLTVVERRLLYLENKDLDVSDARKILKNYVTKYIAKSGN